MVIDAIICMCFFFIHHGQVGYVVDIQSAINTPFYTLCFNILRFIDIADMTMFIYSNYILHYSLELKTRLQQILIYRRFHYILKTIIYIVRYTIRPLLTFLIACGNIKCMFSFHVRQLNIRYCAQTKNTEQSSFLVLKGQSLVSINECLKSL